MADVLSSQAQQMTDLWKKMMDEQAGRVATVFEEVSKLEATQAVQAHKAIAESSKLATDGMDYMLKLNAEWRKQSMDLVKKSFELMTPKS